MAVAFAVFEANDAMRFVLKLLLQFVGHARGIRHVQSALLIEVGHDRPIHFGRASHDLNLKSIGNCKVVCAELHDGGIECDGELKNPADQEQSGNVLHNSYQATPLWSAVASAARHRCAIW